VILLASLASCAETAGPNYAYGNYYTYGDYPYGPGIAYGPGFVYEVGPAFCCGFTRFHRFDSVRGFHHVHPSGGFHGGFHGGHHRWRALLLRRASAARGL